MANLTPTYSKEFAIFEKDTLRNIETFRAARKNWLLTKAGEETDDKEKEHVTEFNVCNAKFPYLKKLKPPLTSCSLYKTLKPLKYYTLKPRISDDGGHQSQKRRIKVYEVVTPTVVEPTKEKVVKTKFEPDVYRWKPKSEPCQEAINKLRAAHFKEGLIESCRCDDGREVTVIIKGICLCDKNSLNNIKLNKVCAKFCKFGVPPEERPMSKPQEEEKAETDIGESSKDESNTTVEELLEEKLTKFSSEKLSTSLKIDGNSEIIPTSEGKPLKKVDFNDEDIKRKMQPRKFPNIGDSELTIYRKIPTSENTLEASPSSTLKVAESAKQPEPVNESNKPRQEVKFTDEAKGDVSNWSVKSLDFAEGGVRNIKKSSAVRDFTEPINKPVAQESNTRLVGSTHDILPHSVEKQKTQSLLKLDSDATSKITVLDEKLKEAEHVQSKSASIISIFKNYHQEPSTLGLTKEQMEVLKKNERMTIPEEG